MIVTGYVELIIGIVAIILGALAIVFRQRYTAWQNRVARPGQGQEVTTRLTIISGAILAFAGFGVLGLGLANLLH